MFPDQKPAKPAKDLGRNQGQNQKPVLIAAVQANNVQPNAPHLAWSPKYPPVRNAEDKEKPLKNIALIAEVEGSFKKQDASN